MALLAGAALAIGGTAMLLSARSTYKGAEQLGCKTTGGPACESKASDVENANTISKALYVGAGLAGATGAVLLLMAPGLSPEGGAKLGFGLGVSF